MATGDSPESRTPQTPSSKSSRLPQTPRTPSQPLIEPPLPEPKRLDASAPAFVPRFLQASSSETTTPIDSNPHSPRAPTGTFSSPSVSEPVSDPGSENDSDLSDTDDPNLEYVRLKLKHYELQTTRGLPQTHKKLVRLQQRISLLKGDSLFDEKAAELQFRSEKTKVDKVYLHNRLRGQVSTPPRTARAARAGTSSSPSKPQTSEPPAKKGLFDDADDDGEGGGILGLLEPPTESTSDGREITLREMNLPKHSSGRTPKSSLKECVAKLDKYAAITYTIVSGSSRAVRASVSILWEGRRRDDWMMEDVACPDEAQAEQYIATIALHALTFPPTDGFAAGNVSVGGSQTFFRSLPPAFRDLWDELEAQRKECEDKINRALWTKLRTITADKYAASSKVSLLEVFFSFILTPL